MPLRPKNIGQLGAPTWGSQPATSCAQRGLRCELWWGETHNFCQTAIYLPPNYWLNHGGDTFQSTDLDRAKWHGGNITVEIMHNSWMVRRFTLTALDSDEPVKTPDDDDGEIVVGEQLNTMMMMMVKYFLRSGEQVTRWTCEQLNTMMMIVVIQFLRSGEQVNTMVMMMK